MIAGTKVDFGEDTGAIQLVKKIFDFWQWVLVLDGDIIQLPVIHTEANGTVLLIHEDNG